MAFIRKVGGKYQVRQGNNNDLLSTFSSREKAEKERDRLHRKNKPKSANRGASARSKHRKGN